MSLSLSFLLASILHTVLSLFGRRTSSSSGLIRLARPATEALCAPAKGWFVGVGVVDEVCEEWWVLLFAGDLDGDFGEGRVNGRVGTLREV